MASKNKKTQARGAARRGPDHRLGEEDIAFLKNYRIEDFERPSVTTDVVAVTLRSEATGDWRVPERHHAAVLLIRRGVPPFKGFWALPGGFLRPTETVEDCARRELMEETGLETRALLPIGSFSAPGRDPRGWILSNAFLSVVESRSSEVRSGDDAAAAVWCAIRFDHDARDGRSLLVLAPEDGAAPFGVALKVEKDDVGRPVFSADGVNGSLAFDHAAILAAALGRLRTDYAVRELAFAFLPETFTLAELHDVFRLFGIADDTPANFRRKLLPFVEPTGDVRSGEGHRPAALFRRRNGELNP
jgi:ADP-ribose pyrophosphatase YjhB (NUDIX family)